MATYKGIQGFTVQSLASDPPAAQSVGQLWYNSASNVWKLSVSGTGAWASGGDLNTAVGSNLGFGIQTAALSCGGAPVANEPQTETYDGTTWTEVGVLNTGRQAQGTFGVLTAGMVAGGYNPSGELAEAEDWNGASWTETTDINTARTSIRGCGTTTAGLIAGGYAPPPTLQMDITELWNGTGWTEVNDMNTRRNGAGISIGSPATDAIIFGGYTQPPPNTANAEVWNGTSWTEVADLGTAKDNIGGSGTSSTSALCFGGKNGGFTTNTESWNGTSWTEVANLALARGYGASAGSASSALFAGGEAPGAPYYKENSEEWNDPVYATKTVTTS
jgi:hypothetical protein